MWNRAETPPGNSTPAKRWGAHACFSPFSTKSSKNDFSSELARGRRARPNTRRRVEKVEIALLSLPWVSGQVSELQRPWLKNPFQARNRWVFESRLVIRVTKRPRKGGSGVGSNTLALSSLGIDRLSTLTVPLRRCIGAVE